MKQGILEVSTTKVYPIGKRIALDERVFRYAYAGQALRASWGAQGWMCYSDAANVEDATIAAAGVVGDNTILCTAVGTVTENMYEGGYALVRWEMSYYRIISNTAATPGNTFTITVEGPLWENINAASLVTLYRNPWADTRLLEGAGMHPLWASTVGIPRRDVALGDYYWCQTWGPCSGVLVADLGDLAAERGLYFLANGALYTQTGEHATNNYPANQYAGFLLPYTGPGPAGRIQPGGLCFFMLQLSP
ncbi:hypothetical protein ES703_63108 [subsurface metagenome]